MIASRRSVALLVGLLLILVGLGAPARSAGAEPEVEPAWRIVEVAVPVTAGPGAVGTAAAECPAGHEVIGGDIRDLSDFRFLRIKASFPDWGNQRYLGAAAADSNHGNQQFTVVAYCLPSSLASGVSVKQVSYNPPGGAFGQGPAGGAVTCDAGQRMIGGGARLWDYTTQGTGFLFSSSPLQTSEGWYGTASLNTSSMLVEALCLPAAKVPTATVVTMTVDNTVGAYAYFVGSPSVSCPDGTRVLSGGAYTAVDGQFPNPADPQQGYVAASHSENGYWFATIGMNHGYESTTIARCIPDADPPTVTMTGPVASPLSGRVSFSTAVKVTWTGTDGADYVAGSQARWRSAPYNGTYGAWQYPASWQNLTGFTVNHGGLGLGATYCYSARGRDPAGNWSPWAAARCAVRPLDDRSLAVSAGWTRGTGTPYWNGTFTGTTQQGATLTRTGARFNQLALVATKCPTCGRVAVEVNGTQVGIVNLAAATTAHRQVIALPRTPSSVGTVTIIVLTSGKQVSIDGLAVVAN